MTFFPEPAYYALAGHSTSPRDVITEMIEAERLGIGNCFPSLLNDLKEIAEMGASVSTRLVGDTFSGNKL